MKPLFKKLGISVLVIAGVFVLAFGFLALRVESSRGKRIVVSPAPISIPADLASIEEGKRLVQTKACSDCHGLDYAGKVFVDEAPVGRFAGPNLTKGKGSKVANYTDVDWDRAIRFGLDPEGRPLVMMPAGDFHGISNREMGLMIAYLKALPPVDRENPAQSIGPVARVLYNFGQMPLLFSYEGLDLNAKFVEDVKPAPTAEYGKYLSMGCIGCHGPGFSGGHIPGTPPDWADAKNLTPSGRVAQWSLEEFKKVLREGLTPDGHQINPQFMPWKATAALNDTEIIALYEFVKTLPAREAGTR